MADPRGSVIGVANSAGTVTAKNKYDAYGAPAAGNQGRFQYTGQVFLAEAGLYHYKARADHPGLGRFLQTDPIGYADGLNMYAYVGNDPVNATDPSGLSRITPCSENPNCVSIQFNSSGGGGSSGGGRFGGGGGGDCRHCGSVPNPSDFAGSGSLSHHSQPSDILDQIRDNPGLFNSTSLFGPPIPDFNLPTNHAGSTFTFDSGLLSNPVNTVLQRVSDQNKKAEDACKNANGNGALLGGAMGSLAAGLCPTAQNICGAAGAVAGAKAGQELDRQACIAEYKQKNCIVIGKRYNPGAHGEGFYEDIYSCPPELRD